MSAYLDASRLAMLILEDESWTALRRWLAGSGESPLYSDFGRGELISAIAARLEAPLATADRRQANTARALGVSNFNPLEEHR